MKSSTIMPLLFKVTRQPHEFIKPSKPTPHDYKLLSDLDDQQGLRCHVRHIWFYKNNPTLVGQDPVKTIREAIEKTLVFYYPFAGRLREVGPGRKLLVECTGEGILFIEADADVSLEEFGDLLHPPFPCFEELLYDVPGSSGIIDSPLALFQVTRLRCGGFILTLRLNHTMCDVTGCIQFITAVSEMARGASAPSVLPIWQRKILMARNPPRVTCSHPEFDRIVDNEGTLVLPEDMAYRSFFFGSVEVATLRNLVPSHLSKCSTFELLIAFIWKFRTMALQPEPEEEMRIAYAVNWRGKRAFPPLPMGYYGNAFVSAVAISTARELCANSLGYALELIMTAKHDVTQEHFRSLVDFLLINGRPHYVMARTFFVSDIRRAGFDYVDFGWGSPTYGGTPGALRQALSLIIPFKNKRSENEILIPLYLPVVAMNIFETELDKALQNIQFVKSAL